MKRFGFRYIWIPVLCMLLLLTGCSLLPHKPAENDDAEQILAELNAMKEQLNAANNELEALKEAEKQNNTATVSVDTSTPEPVVTEVQIPVESIVGKNCTLNGRDSVRIEGETEVHAVANEIEGYVFDHWVVDGEEDYESGPDAYFTFSYPVAVCAVYHERRIVTFKNCHMTLLDKKGNSVGKSYTEFDFEEDYTNPETKQKIKGGTIEFYVFADVPKGMEVDYWLINNVVYEMPYNNIVKFRVEDQTEATLYEVVFRKETTKKQCTVLTENCWFTGGSYTSGTTYGTVPEGTKITVTGKVSMRSAAAGYFEGNPSGAGKGSPSSPLNYSWHDDTYYYFSYSYTVKSDTMITFHPIFGAG
ncbi:MAG: hypothetical protein IJK88_10585 [Clostridia bacterium]|nr:hypothetical protein [Clostridia bacterium]